jgi:sugar phosphate isomerase/epimerase
MTYSLSGFLFEQAYNAQSITFEEFCRLAVKLGYSGIELRRTQIDPGTSRVQRKEMLDAVQAKGLSVTCLTTRKIPGSGVERDDFLLNYLELCTDMECKLLKTGGEPDWMRWAADKAKPLGISLAQNNHVGSVTETVKGTQEFLTAGDRSNIRLLYDPMHLFWGGEDYIGAISKFARHIANVLVHSIRPPLKADGAAQNEMTSCMPDDPGAQDWRGIYRELKAIRYTGLVTIIENGWPPTERERVAKRNIDFLRSLE